MHKCKNNSTANVYHLEQMVGDFFPYSQEKLGFDKPVTIVFQSDEDNSSRMLGKTAYYDPAGMEVVLYVDGRHPKDIMRSLSHELVHHAQNCRGDFTNDSATPEGYAQKDPHLRKMEREAYTKGNLIFRDYEDLIKTGKKEVDIDFSKSGEPKMSLKEWKNNEINTKLMKKWGFLKESQEVTAKDTEELTEMHEGPHGPECGCPDQDLEEGAYADQSSYRKEDDDLDESHIDLARRRGQLHKALTSADFADAKESGVGKRSEKDPADFTGTRGRERAAVSALKKGRGLEEEGAMYRDDDLDASSEERLAYEKDPVAKANLGSVPGLSHGAKGEIMFGDEDSPERGAALKQKRRAFAKQFKEGKISVREAKEITRRIIERIKKESK